jgi:hypothetical protein
MEMIRRRISAIAAAAVLAVRLLAPDVGHACESSVAAGTGAAPVMSIEASDSAHAHHHQASPDQASPAASPASPSGDHAHDRSESDTSHPCDCDTDCCCVATAVSILRDTPRIAAQYVASTEAVFALGITREFTWVHHVLPFTIPPPSATLS